MKKLLTLIVTLLVSLQFTFAQGDVAMADGLYSSGKIYVVVVCLAVIVLGLFLYLFSMDKRIQKIENNSNNLK